MKGKLVLLGAAAAALYAGGGHNAAAVTTSAGSPAAARAIAYAQQQIGKPYQWGGTGPDAFDCSGLALMSWRAAGASLERTSQEQWASEPHVSSPQPGDLVFFAGGDGTPTSPGHVGLVIGHDLMIEAYATGYPVRVSTFGLPSSPDGDQVPVGFTDPAARAAA